jgi:hypothetical protein
MILLSLSVWRITGGPPGLCSGGLCLGGGGEGGDGVVQSGKNQEERFHFGSFEQLQHAVVDSTQCDASRGFVPRHVGADQ